MPKSPRRVCEIVRQFGQVLVADGDERAPGQAELEPSTGWPSDTAAVRSWSRLFERDTPGGMRASARHHDRPGRAAVRYREGSARPAEAKGERKPCGAAFGVSLRFRY